MEQTLSKQTLSIGLFDPGMSPLHRVGMAGLYMTLKWLNERGLRFDGTAWTLEKERVTITWQADSAGSKDFFDWLFRESFGIDNRKFPGLIDFAAHRGHLMGDLERISFSEALRMTFLQHNKQNRIPKGTSDKVISTSHNNDKQILALYKPFVNPYAHATAAELLLDSKGRLADTNMIKIKGWLYPGAGERHSNLSGTEIEETPARLICLLYAPVAALYYRLVHRGWDGRYDARRGTAVVLPHLTNLEAYACCYQRYLQAPVASLYADRPSDEPPVTALYADGAGDAGMSGLVALKAGEHLDKLGVTGCTVFTMGTVGWSSQQKTRTKVAAIDDIDSNRLDLFNCACRCLKNRFIPKDTTATRAKKQKGKKQKEKPGPSFFVATSLARGLIADNIIQGRDQGREWFSGFSDLMLSQERAKIISYEKGGLKQMIDDAPWSHEADRKFVEAVHAAIRNRYGALASQAKKRGETIRFDREFERMRTGLARAKNAQTLRAELADLFTRSGGLNKPLQEQWRELLPLFTGTDWQRARDLALLALASYAGDGSKEIESGEETSTDNPDNPDDTDNVDDIEGKEDN